MSIRLLTFLNITLLLVLVYLNFYIKNNFHDLSIAERIATSRIAHERQLITTLNAELTYVTSPKNLKELAKKYLTLEPIKGEQIIKDLEQLNKQDEATQGKNKVAK
jgi:hypothetical protein